LLPKGTSKEPDFYADFKFLFFSSLVLAYLSKVTSQENLPYFRKKSEILPKSHIILTEITPLDSA